MPPRIRKHLEVNMRTSLETGSHFSGEEHGCRGYLQAQSQEFFRKGKSYGESKHLVKWFALLLFKEVLR